MEREIAQKMPLGGRPGGRRFPHYVAAAVVVVAAPVVVVVAPAVVVFAAVALVVVVAAALCQHQRGEGPLQVQQEYSSFQTVALLWEMNGNDEN